MVLRTFNFWRFVGQYRKTIVFNDMFSKKYLKSMVLRTFNFWSFCGQYRDFHYYSFMLRGKKENLFGSVPWANRNNLKFCRTFGRTILITSGVSKKTLTKSHGYSRLFS